MSTRDEAAATKQSQHQQQQRNYYEILNSTSNATFEQLKGNYKQLILQCHPDKLQQDKITKQNFDDVTEAVTATAASATASTTADPNAALVNDNTKFVIINEAWNTLKDPAKRKHYDAELLLTKFQTHSNIFEHLTLADMDKHREEDLTATSTEAKESETTMETFYTYNCRCGGQYIIDESAAADNGIYVERKKATTSATARNRIAAISTHNNDCDTSACQDAAVEGDKDDGDDDEVMIECSECSLVIVLSNAKR